MLRLLCVFITVLLLAFACTNDPDTTPFRYYEIGFHTDNHEWRDTSFVVAAVASDTQLINQINAQLALPEEKRNKIVVGSLSAGDAGYNKNGPYSFKWHLNEQDWSLTDMTVEIYDGKPYTDVDLHNSYWMNTVKRFGPWSSYVKKEITP